MPKPCTTSDKDPTAHYVHHKLTRSLCRHMHENFPPLFLTIAGYKPRWSTPADIFKNIYPGKSPDYHIVIKYRLTDV